MFELMTGRAPYRKQGGLIAIFYHATKVRSIVYDDTNRTSRDANHFLKKRSITPWIAKNF